MSVPATLDSTEVGAMMQREHERNRLTVDGKRTDDSSTCTLLAVCEIGGTWALYPHGAAQLGVRITQTEATKLAQAILTDGAR